MLKSAVLGVLSAYYENRILIFDFENVNDNIEYEEWLKELDFEVYYYIDKLEFRVLFESKLKQIKQKIAVIVRKDIYVPYDIKQFLYQVNLSWSIIYPNLDQRCLLGHKNISQELIYIGYQDYVGSKMNLEQSVAFIENVFANEKCIIKLTNILFEKISQLLKQECLTYKDWFSIAEYYSLIIFYDSECNKKYDFSVVNQKFYQYILADYGKIPSIIDSDGPVINTRVIDYIFKDQKKIAFIVMDGMSISDYFVIRQTLTDFELEEKFIFSMIPTVTPVSRQSLITGKFPIEMANPFSLKDEKKMFVKTALEYGYIENQIEYFNGINHEINNDTSCLLMIINSVDDMLHSQTQGRRGLVSDLNILTKSQSLQALVSKLFEKGFDIYISSDHGNTQAIGLGKLIKTGVEVETRSSRMLILRDIVKHSNLVDKYKLSKYPGYFLDKNYSYYLCNYGESMDVKDSVTLCHGGASIEEVIVPFVRIKEKRNG